MQVSLVSTPACAVHRVISLLWLYCHCASHVVQTLQSCLYFSPPNPYLQQMQFSSAVEQSLSWQSRKLDEPSVQVSSLHLLRLCFCAAPHARHVITLLTAVESEPSLTAYIDSLTQTSTATRSNAFGYACSPPVHLFLQCQCQVCGNKTDQYCNNLHKGQFFTANSGRR